MPSFHKDICDKYFYDQNSRSLHSIPSKQYEGCNVMTWDRKIHTIRDPSGEGLTSYRQNRQLLVRSSVKEGEKYWLPGENYLPCSRFKRLLRDCCIPQEKTKIITTNCLVCDMPMKVKIFPSNNNNNKLIVEEVWGEKVPPENPQIQQLFDSWLYSSNPLCCTTDRTETKPSTRKPHHYRHHNVIKPAPPPHYPREKFTFCAGCPDRYRGWIRSAKPDHYLEPMLMLTRMEKTEDEEFVTSEASIRSRATKVLRETLSTILKSDHLPSHITLSL